MTPEARLTLIRQMLVLLGTAQVSVALLPILRSILDRMAASSDAPRAERELLSAQLVAAIRSDDSFNRTNPLAVQLLGAAARFDDADHWKSKPGGPTGGGT